MNGSTPGSELIRWAQAEPSVQALVLIGSQVRAGATGGADDHSDWDFQLITSRPELFDDRAWTQQLNCGPVIAYVLREGRLGAAQKVSALFAGGEIDLVIMPAKRLKLARRLFQFGLASKLRALREGLGGLSVVLRDGYRFIKGEAEWGVFFRRIATEIAPTRLSDEQVRQLAEGFVCDYVSTLRKVDRGEFLAAQRWLHHHLVEVNFRLLHELRQRKGLASFPDGRRLEFLSTESEKIAVAATLGSQPLRSAVEKAAAVHRDLVAELVGATWRWPELPSSLRSK